MVVEVEEVLRTQAVSVLKTTFEFLSLNVKLARQRLYLFLLSFSSIWACLLRRDHPVVVQTPSKQLHCLLQDPSHCYFYFCFLVGLVVQEQAAVSFQVLAVLLLLDLLLPQIQLSHRLLALSGHSSALILIFCLC